MARSEVAQNDESIRERGAWSPGDGNNGKGTIWPATAGLHKTELSRLARLFFSSSLAERAGHRYSRRVLVSRWTALHSFPCNSALPETKAPPSPHRRANTQVRTAALASLTAHSSSVPSPSSTYVSASVSLIPSVGRTSLLRSYNPLRKPRLRHTFVRGFSL